MQQRTIKGQNVTIHRYGTIIVGAGAAGMNCAVHLYEMLNDLDVEQAQDGIAVVTAGKPLGASRMSGSDKQTYYKMGTSPDVADSAEEFAKSLTAAGCCHGDLALAEAIGSLREFYHLVQAGVPFPHDPMGSYIGYKTDHDPYERATSAGPKTSKFMSECLEKQVRRYGIAIHDNQELVHLLTEGAGEDKRIIGVVAMDRKKASPQDWALQVYLCRNVVFAAGGPGALYETSVYPKGQTGIHGLAFEAGLAAENLTESQFGLASTKFRWNVSGTYMQVIPRIFSTDADGKDEREFLTDYFPSMGKMATDIFLKGYQWPFDPQRIENLQSSLVDVLVFNETQQGRRVFMDFRKNPIGNAGMAEFKFDDLEPEAYDYLKSCDAFQDTPIERLAHMNPPAIDIYKENNIDLYTEPLEIAVCAQHSNGGFGVNKWYESSIKHAFVVGEMAGSHGVKRPGGSALNAGQTGGLRAAQYIANVYGNEASDASDAQVDAGLGAVIDGCGQLLQDGGLVPQDVIAELQGRMTRVGSHIRKAASAREGLDQAKATYQQLLKQGFKVNDTADLVAAIQTRHLTLNSIAMLKAIVELLGQGSGSRGSHLVLTDDGVEVHPNVLDADTGQPLRFKPENQDLRKSILRVVYNPGADDLFDCETIAVRPAPTDRKAFEPAWTDYREGRVFEM